MANKESKINKEEMNKRILSIVKFMKNKWEYEMVELINDFEYVNHPGNMDFMSNVREYLIIVENMLRKDKGSEIEINEERFEKDGLPAIGYFTEYASVKYAYSLDPELNVGENESYYMKIEWIELDYKLD